MDTSDIFDDNGGTAEMEEYEEELTAAEVLNKLEDAWLNEKHSPELLEPKMELVECMLEQVNTMDENLSKLKKGDMRTPVHRLEISRIRFIINSYLRLRLSKIQSNIYHYMKTPENSLENNPSRMTVEEMTFAHQYHQDLTEHFSNLALRHIPGAWDAAKVTPSAPGPNLGQAVFVSVRQNCPGVDIPDPAGLGRDDTVDLVEGDQHMMQYNTVANLIDNGSLQLI